MTITPGWTPGWIDSWQYYLPTVTRNVISGKCKYWIMIHLTFSFIQGSLQNKQISRAEVWYTSVRKAQEWAQCILALQHANPPVLQGISKENSETYFLISFFDWLYQCHFEVQLYILVLLPDHSHFQEVTSKNLLPLKHMYFLRPPNMLTILENSTGKRIALTVLKFLQVMPIKKEKIVL